MTVRKLASNPENVHKTKPIFAFLHEYESRYGDLIQVINLENRMRELFPEDPTLEQFAHRYSTPSFDPLPDLKKIKKQNQLILQLGFQPNRCSCNGKKKPSIQI